MIDLNSVCAVVLAAGKGTRMKSSIPKVFHNVAGLPIIGHIIRTMQNAKLGQIITVLNPSISLDHLPAQLRNVDIAIQKEQKGTGDAVREALQHVDTNIKYAVILYGDTPLINKDTILRSVEHCLNNNADIYVLAIDDNTNGTLGKLTLDENGYVNSIVESCDVVGKNVTSLCNVGMIAKMDMLRKHITDIQMNSRKNEIFLTDLVSLIYRSGGRCMYDVLPANEMLGINTMTDLAKAERIFQQNMRNKFLENGVRMIAPETVFFSYDTEIESDVTIHPYVIFGPGVHVKKGTVIDSFCHVCGADIDAASVGPFSRLRPGSRLHQGVKIGNFVEVKNSEVQSSSKVNHLSYIGDTKIGHSTNIGAGTVTCNYDGYRKFTTEIGNNVFIGSNVAMIAPVSIHEGAIVGAGSTISKDVPKDSIALTRPEQVSIDNAAIKFRNKRRK